MTATVVRLRAAAACLLAAAAVLAAGGADAARLVPVRLIGINDFHGNLEPANLVLANEAAPTSADDGKPLRIPAGGAAALAGLVQALRAGQPHSLMLSAGDMVGAAPLVSTLFKHESTVEIMNTIGVQVAITGNHEFDAGVGELKRLVAGGCAATTLESAVTSCPLGNYGGMRFSFISSNVLGADGEPVFAPSAVIRVAGIPIGFVGAVTKTLPVLVSPSGIAGLNVIDEAEAVNRAALRLKAQGVRAIVAIFHEGGELGPEQNGRWNDASCPGARGPIFAIAERLLPDISVIFTGHTHKGYRCVVHGRTLIQGTSYGRGVSVVDIVLDAKTRRIVPSKTRSINLPVLNERTDSGDRERIAASLPAPYAAIVRDARPDPAIAATVQRYADIVAPKANRPIGVVDGRFPRGGGGADSAAGRLIADAQLAATAPPALGGAQIAFMNAGGIRSDLDCIGTPPCTVTFGQVFTMQPFGNTMVVMTLTGAQIKALLESQARPPGQEAMMLQPSRGFAYTWRPGAPAGSRATDITLDGVAIAPEKSYRVTVNSFMAEGGDGFAVLKQGTARDGGEPDLDALLDYLKTERAPVAEPRVHLVR